MTDDSIALRELSGEERRRRSLARDDRLCRRAADGARGAGPDRRRLWRALAGPAGAAQRLPRPGLGDPRRDGRAAHPQAQEGQLLPGLPGAAAGGGEGADGGDPGGLRAGHLDPLGRRAGQGAGHGRHLQEPGQPPVRGDRRAGADLPRAADRGRLALSLDRRDLREGARGRAHRLGRGDHRRRGQHRRPP